MPLVYASVWRESATLLAEHAPLHGNIAQVAQDALSRLQPDQAKLTVTCDSHTFNMLRRDGFVFLVVADEAFGRQIPFAFLERVSEDFCSSPQALKAKAAPPRGLQRWFAPKLKQHMDYCSAHPEELNRIVAMQRKVDEVRSIMVENLDRVLERGERIELLVDKTEELRHSAAAFQRQGRTLQSSMWWANARVKIVVAFAVLLLAVVIFLLACFAGGKNCTRRGQ